MLTPITLQAGINHVRRKHQSHFAELRKLRQRAFSGCINDDKLIRGVKELAWNCFCHLPARKLLNLFALIVDVPQVHRCHNIDSRTQQLLDVLPTVRVSASGVVIREPINDAHLRMTPKNRLHVDHGPALRVDRWNDFQRVQQRPDIRREFELECSDYNILSTFLTPPRFIQHSKRFAYSRCVAEENFQSSLWWLRSQ